MKTHSGNYTQLLLFQSQVQLHTGFAIWEVCMKSYILHFVGDVVLLMMWCIFPGKVSSGPPSRSMRSKRGGEEEVGSLPSEESSAESSGDESGEDSGEESD